MFAYFLIAAPEGQSPPQVISVDPSTVYLNWPQPQTPNGPLPPSYNISRAFSALHHPPPLVDAGVHFPGLGYYKFPSEFVSPGATNDIEFWFRTQHAVGLILFFASPGVQSDLFAVQMRDGKPWLIFDCQSGPAVFTVSQSVRFDDGQWHHVKITRRNQLGTLRVDTYSATQSSPGLATSISANTGVYIGWLPPTFQLVRSDLISKIPFIGCLRDIKSNSRTLDWATAQEAVGVEPQRNGCPEKDNKKAIHLRGGGYVTVAKGTLGLNSSIFQFSLNFRSQLSAGLLLFAHGPTSTFAIHYNRNKVEMKYTINDRQGALDIQLSSGEICDGQWHNLTMTNIYMVFDDVVQIINSSLTNLRITSSVYVGGVPWGSVEDKLARQVGLDVDASFGGCIRISSLLLDVDYAQKVEAIHNADLDGCLPESTVTVSSQIGSCLPFNSSTVYSGKAETFNDSTVEHFTGKKWTISLDVPPYN